MGDRARRRRCFAAGDRSTAPDVVAGTAAGEQLLGLTTTQTGPMRRAIRPAISTPESCSSSSEILTILEVIFFGTNDHLTKLHVLLGALFFSPIITPVGGAVGDRPVMGLPLSVSNTVAMLARPPNAFMASATRLRNSVGTVKPPSEPVPTVWARISLNS